VAKAKLQEQEIKKGLETLRQAGVAVDQAAPSLVPCLQQQFGREPQINLAVVWMLGKIADQAAVDVLVQLESETRDKALKKEIRRSLFKLGQKGLHVPDSHPAAASTAALGSWTSAGVEAYMSAVDGAGGRLLWIVKPQAGQGLQTIQAMVSDREGLLRIGGARIRRKEMRDMFREIKEKHGISMVPVSWEYADETIYAAYETAKAQGRSGLENFHELRAVIGVGKPKPQDHPVYRRINVDSARDGDWREQSRRLLEEPEFRYWVLEEDWVSRYLSQLEDAKSSRLVLNAVQKEERFAGIVRDAVKALCAGELGRVLQRRMEDMALYLLETGREESAKLSAAVAVQTGSGDPGPLDISFLTGLVQKSFAFYLSQQKTKQSEEPSLIVRP
jgi:hypothetical protein